MTCKDREWDSVSNIIKNVRRNIQEYKMYTHIKIGKHCMNRSTTQQSHIISDWIVGWLSNYSAIVPLQGTDHLELGRQGSWALVGWQDLRGCWDLASLGSLLRAYQQLVRALVFEIARISQIPCCALTCVHHE